MDKKPLKHDHYLLLLSLAGRDLHGYALKKAVARRTGGQVRISAGSLYRSLRQLVARGYIAESDWRPDPGLDDERRTYFTLTPAGRAAAAAETDRLAALVADARSSGLEGAR